MSLSRQYLEQKQMLLAHSESKRVFRRRNDSVNNRSVERKMKPSRYPSIKMQNGKMLCRGCGNDVPKGRLTWCSQDCYRTRCPAMVIHAVKQRDGGICQICLGDIAQLREWHLQQLQLMRCPNRPWNMPPDEWAKIYSEWSKVYYRIKKTAPSRNMTTLFRIPKAVKPSLKTCARFALLATSKLLRSFPNKGQKSAKPKIKRQSVN